MITLRPKLHALIQVLVVDKLIFADQNSPRPSLPYWTLRLQVQRKVGEDERTSDVTVDGIQTITGVREATIQLQCIGEGADLKCADVKDLLSKRSVLDTWALQQISIYDIGDVLNVPYKLDNTQLEPRASVDLFIRFAMSLTDDVGVIDSVQTEMQFDSKPDLTATVEVVL